MARTNAVQVAGRDELRDLYRALRRQSDSKARVKKLRRDLTLAAKPIVPIVKANIRTMPSQGESARRGRAPLRRRMAKSVTLQVKFTGRDQAGVYVFMNPRKMPDQQKALPGYFELLPGKTRFRHPVFGNTDKWVQQIVPQQGYFTRSLGDVEDRAATMVAQIIEETARDIEDS